MRREVRPGVTAAPGEARDVPPRGAVFAYNGRMKASRYSSLLVLAALPVLGLAACDGDDGSNTGGGGSTTTTTGGTGGTPTGGGGTGGTPTGGGGTGGAPTGGGGTGGAPTGGGGAGGGTGGGPTVDCSPAEGAVPALQLTTVAQGLDRPVFVRAAPGDDTRLFIVEQSGTIRIFKDGALQPTPFLDLTDRVHPPSGGDERGLLGLAFHPDYAANGRFFVFYTQEQGSPGDQVIAEFARADADTAMADANGFGAEVQKLLTIADSEGNHNGGMLEFSAADGMLYIGLGDGGGGGDQHGPIGNGQNLATLWGKILRIDVSTTPYSIPAGNMTAVPPGNLTMGDVKPEIWDFGLRNPWRFAFDPCTDDLYIGDVGQGSIEEVDIEAKGTGQKNYGWKYYEGTEVYSSNTPGFAEAMVTPPVDEYSHDGGNCSISGGFVHRSSAIPGLRGRYFYGDYCSGRVWSFRWDGAMIQDKMEHTNDLNSPGSLVSFGYDNVGNVYVTSLNGDVYRIDAE